jgi:Dimerisation domain
MTNATDVTPDAILQLGSGFWASKALLSAVELGLFTTLADGPRTGKALMAELGLQPRGTTDWIDALVSLGMFERSGDEYANTAGTDLFLDRNKPSYIGGMLEMANARLYPFWGSLTEALRTGHPQNEARVGENFFTALYQGSRPAPAIPALHDRPQHGCRGGHRREDPVGSL